MRDMRGTNDGQGSMLVLLSPETLVPTKHPARDVKRLADDCLRELSSVFDEMYARIGRPSIPPERLLKSMLLMAFYSISSERMFCERLRYDLLFRWFLDMSMVDEPFDASSFSRNRERLLEHEVAHRFLQTVVGLAAKNRLMSSEHFSVDGTLIQAWASMKSFRPKNEKDDDRGDGNGWADFKGQPRSNDTHESRTDPEAKLLRKGKGQEAKLVFAEHLLMENRNGLIVDVAVKTAVGVTEPEAALELLARSVRPGGDVTVGADKGYDTKDFIKRARQLGATPHVSQNVTAHRGSAIDGRTSRHPGYAISQVFRRRIESIFGWTKTVGGCRKSRYRGVKKTDFFATMVAVAYNLTRIGRLLTATT
jgi:transposase